MSGKVAFKAKAAKSLRPWRRWFTMEMLQQLLGTMLSDEQVSSFEHSAYAMDNETMLARERLVASVATSKDYSKYNEHEEFWELVVIALSFGKFFARAGAHLRAMAWCAVALSWMAILPTGGDPVSIGRPLRRCINSLFSGSRLTMLLNTINHMLYLRTTEIYLAALGITFRSAFPRNLRTHILRLLGPKTILSKAFGLF